MDKVTEIGFSKTDDGNDYLTGSEVEKAYIQIQEYLNNKRKEFELCLAIDEPEFTSKVYNALQKIPYGTIKTYKDIAIEVGNPNASRAVGNVNNRNKFAIVIPCHRVIGTSNKMVGYAPGIMYKEYLLDLERKGD